jgi:RNA polymerase sigma factor (sigma-70 family)
MPEQLDDLVTQARDGNLNALEAIIRAIQDRIYHLALRMLSDPEDARDATQEILVKVVTNLATFRGESAFSTWAYRIAANYLLTTRKRRAELRERSFAQLGDEIVLGLESDAPTPETEVDEGVLAEEVRLSCALGMLQCLDRPHRLALILGEVIQVSSAEGGAILGISSAAYRQRLTRGRRSLVAFMRGTCGLVNPDAPCRCAKQVPAMVAIGRLDPAHLRLTAHPTLDDAQARVAGIDPALIAQAQAILRDREVRQLDRAGALLRSHPAYAAPETFVGAVRRLLDSGQLALLQH